MKNMILFLGMIILFASCKKEDDTPIDVVKKLKTYIVDNETFEFIYTDSRLTSIIHKDSGVVNYTEEFVYSGDKLMKRVFSKTKGGEDYYLYSNHNFHDLPTYVARHSSSDNDTLPNFETFYTYNSTRLVEQKFTGYDYPQEWTFNNIFTYMNDNIIRNSIYFSIDTMVGEANVNSFEFDNMKNPGKDIGLFSNFRINHIAFLNLINRNNIVKSQWISPDGIVEQRISYNYIYEYDVDNYPTKCTMSSFDNSMVLIHHILRCNTFVTSFNRNGNTMFVRTAN